MRASYIRAILVDYFGCRHMIITNGAVVSLNYKCCITYFDLQREIGNGYELFFIKNIFISIFIYTSNFT